MIETLKDLKERRSCRKYLDKQISDDELNQILEAGTYAPTGMGRQSPVIVCIQNKTFPIMSLSYFALFKKFFIRLAYFRRNVKQSTKSEKSYCSHLTTW